MYWHPAVYTYIAMYTYTYVVIARAGSMELARYIAVAIGTYNFKHIVAHIAIAS